MHGRPRRPAKPEDADSIAKATELQTLQSQLLFNHHNKKYDKEGLVVCSKLLEVNPEIYTAWNYRKLAVENHLQSVTDTDAVASFLDEELRVVERALRRNPKCYGAWHHRKWVLSKGFSSINREFMLLDKLLKLDARNFHGWNYRRFVAGLKDVSAQEELKFTTEKINANFSNYSAWHNRCMLLAHLLREKVQEFFPKEKVLTQEYDLIHQAIFTDPDDQSGWFYHLWLLDQTVILEDSCLTSSWPGHGSVVTLAQSMDYNCPSLTQSASSNVENLVDSGAFPIILYFSQPVEGVNSSTVHANSEFGINEDLVWKPLSTNRSGKAQAWMTYLKIPNLKSSPSNVYSVQISVGDAPGIYSSIGYPYKHPSQVQFFVKVESVGSERSEGKSDKGMVFWNEENFSAKDDNLEDLNSFVDSFDKLNVSEHHQAAIASWQIETIENEISLFRELVSEMDCKIGKLTLARLLVAYDELMVLSTKKRSHSEEVLGLFNDLIKQDPAHLRYYMDERSLLTMEQVTSSVKSLAKYCSYCNEVPFSSSSDMCIRLNKLSLTRVGFIERLLWVQMLDLSHNELRSIEGLEAMQLLTSLNLSNNRICSFTALEPLTLIRSLRVLNISYNEIGSHPIDTTRYLCCSPLSHSMEAHQKLKQVAVNDEKALENWEAILTLGRLHLIQLDIVGNAVNDANFGKLVMRVLPSLKWLDGNCIR